MLLHLLCGKGHYLYQNSVQQFENYVQTIQTVMPTADQLRTLLVEQKFPLLHHMKLIFFKFAHMYF